MHPAYEFWDDDFVRKASERLQRSKKIAVRASKLFLSDTIIRNKGQAMAYNLGNPRPNLT